MTEYETSQLPEGFEEVSGKPFFPTVQYTDLILGALVKWVGRTRIDSGHVKYEFRSDAGAGEPFSVFACAQLNGKLANFRPNTVLWIKYEGKHPQKDDPSRDEHVWMVMKCKSAAQIASARTAKAPSTQKLNRVIAEAIKMQDRYRAGTSPAERDAGAPPPDDKDLPF